MLVVVLMILVWAMLAKRRVGFGAGGSEGKCAGSVVEDVHFFWVWVLFLRPPPCLSSKESRRTYKKKVS